MISLRRVLGPGIASLRSSISAETSGLLQSTASAVKGDTQKCMHLRIHGGAFNKAVFSRTAANTTGESITWRIRGPQLRTLTTSAPASPSTSSASVPAEGVLDAIASVDPLLLLDPSPTGYWPPDFAETAIVAIHNHFGLPWYLSIAGITLSMRFLLFPLTIYQVRGQVHPCYVESVFLILGLTYLFR